MKVLRYLLVSVLVLAMIPLGAFAETGQIISAPINTEDELLPLCNSWDLVAGQNIDVGNVIVSESVGTGRFPEITVEFNTTAGWELVVTHVAVVDDPADFPQTRKGNPKVGLFDSRTDHTYTYSIPDITTEIGKPIYIAAQAEVINPTIIDQETGEPWAETAWGGSSECIQEETAIPFDGSSWATYFTYYGGNGMVSISENVKLLTDESWQLLSEVSPDGMTFTFVGCSNELDVLSPGDIIVSSIGETTPDGLLREITNIISSDCVTTIETEQATLEDAIVMARIQGTWTLPPNTESINVVATAPIEAASLLETTDTDLTIKSVDGIWVPAEEATTVVASSACEGFHFYIDHTLYEDGPAKVKAKGSLCFDLGIDIDWEIEDSEWQMFHLSVIEQETAELEIQANLEIPIVSGKITIPGPPLPWIVLWVGFLPVVIVPELELAVGVDGSVTAGLKSSITLQTTTEVGVHYSKPNWSPIADYSPSFSWNEPEVDVGASVKGYAGPQLAFELYGIVGPWVQARGYLELETSLFDCPWWELSAGGELVAGCRAEVLGITLAEYEFPTTIGFAFPLAQAECGGTISGSVQDAITSDPLEAVLCEVYNGDISGDPVAGGYTNASGTYELNVSEGTGYIVQFSKEGYLPASYYDISVQVETTTYLEAVLQIDEIYAGLGDVTGTIRNALDNTGVGGVSVSLRDGINQTAGPIVATTTTLSSGFYMFEDLEAGHYTAEISKTGFITTYFTVTCVGGVTMSNQNATISPIISPGQTRIVLTWGANPSDLDAHFTGPLTCGGRFHMYWYYAESCPNHGNCHGSPWPSLVQLDIDDITSYGPETVTLLDQTDGMYRFSVHDYTNRNSSYSFALSDSGAQVAVFRGSALVSSFVVPSATEGTLWTVFEMEGDTITPVNILAYHSDTSTVP